jgi:hypothetical protein
MLQGMGRGATRVVGPRVWLIAILGVMAMAISGVAAGAASAETTWLCKPGIANNPCESSLETTLENANGTTFIEHAQDARNPPIDCFYVYPTVSGELALNASGTTVGPEERQIAVSQAARFSQTCKVYAPIYPQLTLAAINGAFGPEAQAKGAEIAYIGMATAFAEYISKYNKGRPFVLIGHSQGSALLIHLIQEQFDASTSNAALLRQGLVSAILLGGNVIVPKGKTEGGSFTKVPSCQTVVQTHCVVAYSSFLKEPPNPSFFGRVESPLLGGVASEEEANNDEVLCVNPSVFIQSNNHAVGPLFRYESTTPFPGPLGEFVKAPTASTPWVGYPGQYTGECESANGATWLQLTDVGGANDKREQIQEVLGPLWGTHLEDVNASLGNLVALTATQAAFYPF